MILGDSNSTWWRRAGAAVASALGVMILAACAALDAGGDADERCGLAGGGGRRAVDWAAAPAIAVDIQSGEFTPAVLDLHKRQPYRLIVSNHDAEDRVFNASAFLHRTMQAGVRRSGQVAGAADCPASITLAPGETVEIPLIPLRRGRYEVAETDWALGVWGTGLGVIYVR